MIPPNVIIPYDGTHASIPSGFVRDTRFDGKFPKGAATGFADTGGSDAHTHTVTHTHTVATHLHSSTTSDTKDGGTYSMGSSGNRCNANHYHNGEWRSATMGTEASGETAATLASAAGNTLPPYYEVIFLKSTGYSPIPIDGMIYHTGTRAGLTYHTASENKYLRGAGTGANAGGTGGGTSHNHTNNHTHTANNHSHTDVQTKYEGPSGEDGGSSPSMSPEHSHTIYVANAAQAMNANTDSSSTTSSVEPPYYTLKHYKASAKTMPKPGDIALTTETNPPVGWITCDGNNSTPNLANYFIKNTSSAGSTGGAATHTHTLSHIHTGNGTHTHTPNANTEYSGSSGGRNGSGKNGIQSHRHYDVTVSSVTANYNTNTVTTSSDGSNEPAYIKVQFIQYQFSAMGGAVLFMS